MQGMSKPSQTAAPWQVRKGKASNDKENNGLPIPSILVCTNLGRLRCSLLGWMEPYMIPSLPDSAPDDVLRMSIRNITTNSSMDAYQRAMMHQSDSSVLHEKYIDQLLVLFRAAIQSALPEKRGIRTDMPMEPSYSNGMKVGHNKAISEIEVNFKKKGLL
jgi:hypothetical protein